jgi:adenosyl cobinamide kinase/adenosyl cobinamide phosphate guanylyltransferase
VLIVLTGGVRSGKTSLAVALARRSPAPVVYLATCPRIDGDDEFADRIDAHRAERPEGWATVEAEYALGEAITEVADGAFLVVDCLTTWVGNRFYGGDDEPAVLAASDRALAAAADRSGDTVVVTNEVGLGIVPADRGSRAYRDTLGRVNQAWVGRADRALLLVAGRALPLHDPDDLLG